MVLWINGAYGSGKSTVAEKIRARFPDAVIFDAEQVGNAVRDNLEKAVYHEEFPDYALWREFTARLLTELAGGAERLVLVPMTVPREEHMREILGTLEKSGTAYRHVILDAEPRLLEERILARGEDADCWCMRQRERSCELLSGMPGIHIDASGPADEVVEAILSQLEACGPAALETPDLILGKAKPSDWTGVLKNVWSRPECARYMLWKLTDSEESAKARIERTIEFQKTHEAYLVYEKASGEPIGFAGVKRVEDGVYEESGICLGPDFQRRGYGKQLLRRLLDYCRDEHGAREFIYSTREQNEASRALAASFGFTLTGSEEMTDYRDGQKYTLLRYKLRLL